ncbi:MAG: hypothetical protein ACJ8F7_00620 [Gemmataceae bacterium]
MRWQKLLAALGFWLLLVSGLAAMPPQPENKVPLFPLGEEYRESDRPAPPPAPAPAPRRDRPPVPVWKLLADVFITPFQLLLPPTEF